MSAMAYRAKLNNNEISFDPCDFGKGAKFVCRDKVIASKLTTEFQEELEISGLGPSRPSVQDSARAFLEDCGAEIVEWPEEPENAVY